MANNTDNPGSDFYTRKQIGNKRQWTDLPWSVLGSVVDVFQYGNKKYGQGNWQGSISVATEAEYLSAIFRHLHAHMEGEVFDPGSEKPHLAHVAANCLILMWGRANK